MVNSVYYEIRIKLIWRSEKNIHSETYYTNNEFQLIPLKRIYKISIVHNGKLEIMWANAHIMIVSFGFWDEMIKNLVLICNNLFEQIIIRLFTKTNEGFTWLWAVIKTFALVDESLDSVYGVREMWFPWLNFCDSGQIPTRPEMHTSACSWP